MIDWTNFLIGHLYSPSSSIVSNPDSSILINHFVNEINEIKDNFNMSRISFISFPIEIISNDLNSLNSLNGMINHLNQYNISIGIEFSFTLINSLTLSEIVNITNRLDSLIHRLSFVSIPMNGFTYEKSFYLKSWANEKSIKTIAIETLRAHKRRPGLLALDGYSSKDLAVFDINQINNDSFKDILNEMNGSIGKCISMEKKYLEKVINSIN